MSNTKLKKLISLVENYTGKKVVLKENNGDAMSTLTYFEGASNTLRSFVSELSQDYYGDNKNKVINFINENQDEIDSVCTQIVNLSDHFDEY